jgi:hypothetical protein
VDVELIAVAAAELVEDRGDGPLIVAAGRSPASRTIRC